MPAQPITQRRLALMDELGEEAIFKRYLELGSVRKLCWEMFEAAQEGQTPSTRAFYKWLDQKEGRRDRWERTLEMRGNDEFDEIGELADEINEQNVRSIREKIKAKQWRAERLNKKYGSRTNVEVEHSIGSQWLEAVRQAEEQREIPEADARVIEGEVVEEDEGEG